MPFSPLGSTPGVSTPGWGTARSLCPRLDPAALQKAHSRAGVYTGKRTGEAKQSWETLGVVGAQEPGTALSWAHHSSEANDGKSLSGTALLGFEGFDEIG